MNYNSKYLVISLRETFFKLLHFLFRYLDGITIGILGIDPSMISTNGLTKKIYDANLY